jgi:hypothetical protein
VPAASGAAFKMEGKNTGNGGLGKEKQQLMTTVICAGTIDQKFRISGAGSL